MGRTIAIILSALLFSIIGLLTGYFAAERLPQPTGIDDELIVVSVAPPVVGAVLGLIVGCIAAAFGKWFGTKGN